MLISMLFFWLAYALYDRSFDTAINRAGVFNYDSKYKGSTAKPASILKKDRELSDAGFLVNHARILVGSGLETFEKGKSALQNWRHFSLNWAFVDPKTRIQSGAKFCVCAKEIFPWLVMPLEVVYVDESRNSNNALASFRFGSGTLQGHLLQAGEERFSITMDEKEAFGKSIFARDSTLLMKKLLSAKLDDVSNAP
ncbi:hypothetical protein DH2020_038196 [Rehmannia glutinosa]|uniref:DUF1990 domain-containing protein n=1 Tax=Rehmannia glutinosa TaxID=99300 RepID=A0ABR0V023_REHGL